MSYYKNFKIIIGNPLYAIYLKWAYKKGIEDLQKFNFKPDFTSENFQCLLSGVGNEQTADVFINFIIQRNKHAKIWIIDLEAEQIAAVEKLVKEKYQQVNIVVKQMNALKLDTLIPKGNINWIETDGFLEYFNSKSLEEILYIWSTLLKPDGFITIRDFSTEGRITIISDNFRIWLAKVWLDVTLFRHTKKEFASLFKKLQLQSTEGSTFLPTYKRFSLMKQK